jgi:isocitrate dehydrogenase (NAD+)
MKKADGLFLECARQESLPYQGRVSFDDILVDALAMKLVTNASQFDVLLLENLYGDIVSDLAAGLIGGLGLAPGGNYGPDSAIFEAIHGSAPDIAGRGIANPIAMILSAAMMCHHLGDVDSYLRIRKSVRTVTSGHRDLLTPDLGGSGTTSSLADAIITEIEDRRREPVTD